MDVVKEDFAKFDGANYSGWDHKMIWILDRLFLWDTVTGEQIKAKLNQNAMATTGLSFHDDQLIYIQDCISAKQVWDIVARCTTVLVRQ